MYPKKFLDTDFLKGALTLFKKKKSSSSDLRKAGLMLTDKRM